MERDVVSRCFSLPNSRRASLTYVPSVHEQLAEREKERKNRGKVKVVKNGFPHAFKTPFKAADEP